MSRAQSCLFLVDSVAITMAGDAGSFLPLIRMLSSQKHRRPRLNGTPYFLSLLRYVGAGARIASAPVESAITMETKYITMETRDSLSRLPLCKNSCRPTSRCKTVCVTRRTHNFKLMTFLLHPIQNMSRLEVYMHFYKLMKILHLFWIKKTSWESNTIFLSSIEPINKTK